MDAKHNAKILASILAMECVNFALPAVRPLNPAEIVELRAELRPYLQPFRSSVLKLSKDLNNAIGSDDDYEEIAKAARFIVRVEVEPTLAELREQLAKPTRGWLTRTFDVVKQAPMLATTFATMPRGIFYAQVLAAVGGMVTDLNDKRSASAAARSNMYYLLRLQQANSRPR